MSLCPFLPNGDMALSIQTKIMQGHRQKRPPYKLPVVNTSSSSDIPSSSSNSRHPFFFAAPCDGPHAECCQTLVSLFYGARRVSSDTVHHKQKKIDGGMHLYTFNTEKSHVLVVVFNEDQISVRDARKVLQYKNGEFSKMQKAHRIIVGESVSTIGKATLEDGKFTFVSFKALLFIQAHARTALGSIPRLLDAKEKVQLTKRYGTLDFWPRVNVHTDVVCTIVNVQKGDVLEYTRVFLDNVAPHTYYRVGY